jgi:hypothetical protein
MQILEDKSGTMYEYGCLMLYVTFPNWNKFIGGIDKNLLFSTKKSIQIGGIQMDF